jgi:hypothetical protein
VAAANSLTALKDGNAIDEAKPSSFDLIQANFQHIGEHHAQAHAAGKGGDSELEKRFGEP